MLLNSCSIVEKKQPYATVHYVGFDLLTFLPVSCDSFFGEFGNDNILKSTNISKEQLDIMLSKVKYDQEINDSLEIDARCMVRYRIKSKLITICMDRFKIKIEDKTYVMPPDLRAYIDTNYGR